MPDQDAVLPGERNDVRHSGERDQIEQMVGEIRGKAEDRHQCLDQLERDTGTAELLQTGAVVVALRIHDRQGGRQPRTRKVVVGNHDLESCAPRQVYRAHRGDAAVAGQDQTRAGRLGRGHAHGAQIVAVPQPVREEGGHARTSLTERPGEQCRGALAVHVVIAVDQDADAGAHGTTHRIDRLRHAGEGHRVGQLIQSGAEEATGLIGRLHPAPDQQRGEGRGYAEAVGEGRDDRFGRWVVHDPAQRRNGEATQRLLRRRG